MKETKQKTPSCWQSHLAGNQVSLWTELNRTEPNMLTATDSPAFPAAPFDTSSEASAEGWVDVPSTATAPSFVFTMVSSALLEDFSHSMA